MSHFKEVFDSLVTIFSAIDNFGTLRKSIVSDKSDWGRLLAEFGVKVDGKMQIRGGVVTRRRVKNEWETADETTREERWSIHYYYSYTNAESADARDAQAEAFQDGIVEEILEVLKVNYDIGGNFDKRDAAGVDNISQRIFRGVSVWYCEIYFKGTRWVDI